jgi:hypothetical protein
LFESDVNDIRDKVALLETYAKNERSPDRKRPHGSAASTMRFMTSWRPSTKPARRTMLAKLLDSFIAEQDKKKNRYRLPEQCRNDLVEYFGADKPLADVTDGDAEDWRQWLKEKRISHPGRKKSPTARARRASKRDRDKPKQGPKRLQENTIRRRCGRARQLFQAAVRRRLIIRNPFIELKGVSVLANKSRDYFVTRDEADAVLKACPDKQWQLLLR